MTSERAEAVQRVLHWWDQFVAHVEPRQAEIRYWHSLLVDEPDCWETWRLAFADDANGYRLARQLWCELCIALRALDEVWPEMAGSDVAGGREEQLSRLLAVMR